MVTAPGPIEEPLDPRRLAAMLRNDRSVLRPIERTTAASIIDAFAELSEPTRRLAHAAATVRGRLGEGWEWDSLDRALDQIAGHRPDKVDVGFYLHHDRYGTGQPIGWEWWLIGHADIPTGSGNAYVSLDAAITAALTALEPTP